MAFPLKLGAVYGVVKELSKTSDRPLLVDVFLWVLTATLLIYLGL